MSQGISWIGLLVIGMFIILIASLAVAFVMLLVNRRGHPGAALAVGAAMLALLFMLFSGWYLQPGVQIQTPGIQNSSATSGSQWVMNNSSMTVTQPAWPKILFVPLIGGVLLAIVVVLLTRCRVLFHGHLHGVGMALVGVIALGALLLVVARLSYQTSADRMQSAYVDEQKLMERALAASSRRIPVPTAPSIPVQAAADEHRAEKPEAGADKPATDASEDTRPAWTKVTAHREGDSYLVVVQAESSDPMLREQLLDEKMVLAAEAFIDELMYHRSGVGNAVGFDAEYLRQNCLQNEYPKGDAGGSDQTVFAQVKFDGNFKKEVDKRYRQSISVGRVQQLGGIAAAGLAILGGFYVFLKMSSKRTVQGS